MSSDHHLLNTRCCIAGGGPAGMMLGFLLARTGVPVVVLEKHADFLRDFRGDTVHPSTLQLLAQTGLLDRFRQLPQQRVRELGVVLNGRSQQVIDFTGLKPFDFLSLVPQWDFLNLLAGEAGRYSHFDLRMRHEARELVEENGRVVGVRARAPDGELEIRADLVVACDGRDSRLRDRAGLRSENYGAPMDVLWFRLPREPDHPDTTGAFVGAGKMMILLNRGDYWQAAWVGPKGSDTGLRREPVAKLREQVNRMAPFLDIGQAQLESWQAVKTLEVQVNRLPRWHKAGLLVIGDAAHAMSPIGGVGINLAIQDAVAAANILQPALYRGEGPDASLLQQVQARRELPVRVIQSLQLRIQKRVISRVLAGTGAPPELPGWLRWLLRFRVVRNIPARLIGYGIRREQVQTPAREPKP